MPQELHVYVHIPFCERKCRYCAFASATADRAAVRGYCSALVREIEQTALQLDYSSVPTVYIGGGTPSCIAPSLLDTILAAVRRSFTVSTDAEITVECNPHSLTGAVCDSLLKSGVNRFSLGVQSLSDRELAWLGRLHSAELAEQAWQLLRAAGAANISVDLIFGLPGQSSADWRSSLARVTDCWHPEHLSLYALTLEPGTPLYREYHAGMFSADWPVDDTVMDFYWLAADVAAAAGYQHYEISSYAMPGYESRHNSAYWDISKHYIGFGSSAHSFCRVAGSASPRRFRNIKNSRLYVERHKRSATTRVFSRQLSANALFGEEIILGLRRSMGVVLRPEHFRLFGSTISSQVEDGLLTINNGNRIALTNRGIEIANTVMAEYV